MPGRQQDKHACRRGLGVGLRDMTSSMRKGQRPTAAARRAAARCGRPAGRESPAPLPAAPRRRLRCCLVRLSQAPVRPFPSGKPRWRPLPRSRSLTSGPRCSLAPPAAVAVRPRWPLRALHALQTAAVVEQAAPSALHRCLRTSPPPGSALLRQPLLRTSAHTSSAASGTQQAHQCHAAELAQSAGILAARLTSTGS